MSKLLNIYFLVLVLLFFGDLAQASPPSRDQVIAEIRACAAQLGVKPAFAVAVAQVESGLRCGPLGKRGTYWGPFGIHRDFLKKWDIADWRENCYRGVAALRGRDQRKVLRRYNKAFNLAYYLAVRQAEKRFAAEN